MDKYYILYTKVKVKSNR